MCAMSSLRSNSRATHRTVDAVAAALLALSCGQVQAAGFMVNSVADSGDAGLADNVCDTGQLVGTDPECTLRAAVQQANFSTGSHTIDFAIPGVSPFVIQPATAYPRITKDVSIDGYSQPQASIVFGPGRTFGPETFTTTILIQIDGSLVANSVFQFEGPGGSVSGLSLTDFGLLLNCANSCAVFGNYIGLDPAGNFAGNSAQGIRVFDGLNHTIDHNVIAVTSGSGSPAIDLGSQAGGVRILNNLIGTNPAGNSFRGQGLYGIRINGNDHLLRDNLIAGNQQAGIFIQQGTAAGIRIVGNFIGTNIAGTGSLANTTGIEIGPVSVPTGIPLINIGGPGQTETNLISANSEAGIRVNNAVIIENNLIGSTLSGTGSLPNGLEGIHLVLSIGSQIRDNLIAFNSRAGLRLSSQGDTSSLVINNRISRNRIFSNTAGGGPGLGIDIAIDGITPNDAGDLDTGPNGKQNYPELDQPVRGAGTVDFGGVLRSTANSDFTVEFFSNESCDPLGYGEGRYYWGSALLRTDGNGIAPIAVTIAGTNPGEVFTATATDVDGNTSEFSACQSIVPYAVTDSLAPADDRLLPFGNVPMGANQDATITVDNIGVAAFDVTAIGGGADPIAAPFAIVNDNCSGQSVQAGARCTADVRFSPAAAGGPFDETFLIEFLVGGVPASVQMIATGESISVGADLSVVKSVDKVAALVGDTLTYAITLQNDGPDDATGIEVEDRLPAGLIFVSATTNPAAAYDPASGIWSVGMLAGTGDMATLTLVAEVPAASDDSTVTNIASLLAGFTPVDPDSGDHSASAGTTVGGADLEVVSFERANTDSGGRFLTEYRARIRNNGPGLARGVDIDFDLPTQASSPRLLAGDALGDRLVCQDSVIDTQTGEHRYHCVLPDPEVLDALTEGFLIVQVDRTGNPGTAWSTVSATTIDPTPNNNTVSVDDAGGGAGGGTVASGINIFDCFVATAAYGSYLEPEVVLLRDFRDQDLLTNAPGRAFVAWYYRNSPPIAEWIAKRRWARALTRWALTPIVYAIKYPPLLGLPLLGMFVFVRRQLRNAR